MLASRNTEVRQERHGPARVRAEQAQHPDPRLRAAVDQDMALVVPVPTQRVRPEAERALPTRLVEEQIWCHLVGVEPAANRE